MTIEPGENCADTGTVNVDVDWMDPEYIKTLPFKPHDQTSNQLWVDIQLGHESKPRAST